MGGGVRGQVYWGRERTDDRVDLSELLDAAADNVSRNDTADELDHAVGDAADAVDGDHGVGVVAAVVVPFVLWMLPDAAICSGMSACGQVNGCQERRYTHSAGMNLPPVAASRMMSSAVQKPKTVTAAARTFLVGYLLTC